jgi:hypothetical protein
VVVEIQAVVVFVFPKNYQRIQLLKRVLFKEYMQIAKNLSIFISKSIKIPKRF